MTALLYLTVLIFSIAAVALIIHIFDLASVLRGGEPRCANCCKKIKRIFCRQ